MEEEFSSVENRITSVLLSLDKKIYLDVDKIPGHAWTKLCLCLSRRLGTVFIRSILGLKSATEYTCNQINKWKTTTVYR